ncbi:MAG: hypothetical protein E7668_06335 [Ruminococcaceae bacterium]|nr:hypothetical protein [Oscillospiraceae bacterium]
MRTERYFFADRLRQWIIFAMLGSMMFLSDLLMEFLPNIHLVGTLTMIYTVVYRSKALIPIYIYVFLNGLFYGFQAWWIPYLYVWTILWGITMLLPRRISPTIAAPMYMIVCAIHGFAFGTLYAPVQALMFGLPFRQMLAWIVAGFPFDVIHGVGNFVLGVLILPLSKVLTVLEQKTSIRHGIVKTNKENSSEN